MAKRENFIEKVKQLGSRLLKLESVKQNVGGDVVDIIKGNVIDTTQNIAANGGLILNIIAQPGDQLDHLIRYLWSMEVGEKGKIQLDIDYTVTGVTDHQEVASFANDSHLPITPFPRGHSIVETTDGVLVAIYLDDVTSTLKLYYTSSLDSGATWSSPTLVAILTPKGIASAKEFDADIDSSNNIHLVYNTGTTNSTVFSRKLTRATSSTWTIGSEQSVDGSLAFWPSICVQSNNVIIITYTHYNLGDGQYHIKYRKSTDGGAIYGGATTISAGSSSIIFSKVVRYSSSFMAIYWKLADRKMFYSINGGSEIFAFDQLTSILSNWSAINTPNNQIHMLITDNLVMKYLYWNGINWSSRQNLGPVDNNYAFSLSASGNNLYLYFFSGGNLYYRIKSSSWGAKTFWQSVSGIFRGMTSSRRFAVTDLAYTLVAEDTNSNSIEDTLNIYRIAGTEVSSSLALLITGTTDDGFEEDDTTWDNSQVKVGEDSGGANSWDMALRFNDVTIPQGATIDSATISLIGNETTTSESVETAIKGIKEANAGAISATSRPSTRDKTTADISWTIPDRTINVTLTTPDLSSIFQEIVDQVSWVSGNSLIIVLEDDANTDKKAIFVDYEEQVFSPWYDVYGSIVDVKSWADLATSDSANGEKGFYWVIDNLTANQISVRLKFRGYATWQSSLLTS